MPENNQILSVEGQLVGMPLAGPESFSQQHLDYLKRALGVDETVLWENSSGSTAESGISLSESPYNFEKLAITAIDNNGNGVVQEIPMAANPAQFTLMCEHINQAKTHLYFKVGKYTLSS